MKIKTKHMGTLMKTLVVCISIAGFVSCRKNKDENPQPAGPGVPVTPVVTALGFWQGHYRFTGSMTNHNVKILIKAGGKARLYDMGAQTDTALLLSSLKPDGTWAWNGDKLEVTIPSAAPFLFSGTINPDTEKWTGAWKNNGEVKGTFTLAN